MALASDADQKSKDHALLLDRLFAGNKDAPLRAIALRHAERFSLMRVGQGATRIEYVADRFAEATPALIAANTQPNAPIAADPGTLALLTLAERVAKSAIPVLIEGPTGTGKEVIARYLHNASARREKPFVAVNCAAMPEAMLEALLFGHCKGAFTGANAAGEGFFRAADGGTLLLDEIGEMPLALQSKLLRALQEGEVVPLGATQPQKVDVRIVACTNRSLGEEAAHGRFREDLYYRLNVFPLRLPALRDRPGDIGPLAFGMLLRHLDDAGGPTWVSNEALRRLEHHKWPGNVRELENVIRRAALLAGTEREIGVDHILFDRSVEAFSPDASHASGDVVAFPAPGADRAQSLSDISFESEAQAILDTLDECGGHRRRTAERLGISERTLRYRLANMREAGLKVAGGRR